MVLAWRAHLPQLPATHSFSRKSCMVVAPSWAQARICRSVTALQMQTYMAIGAKWRLVSIGVDNYYQSHSVWQVLFAMFL
jgi:hypothetical protein